MENFNVFKLFKKYDDVDMHFAETVEGAVYPHYPPIPAKEIKPLKEYQDKKYGEYKFPGCPGMHDYSRIGYIIPAWSNFHIKANKAGTVAMVGTRDKPNTAVRSTPVRQPQVMSKEITDGLHEIHNIKHEINNFPGPWKIFSKKGISCLLLPAFFHSKFLDDLYVYPGVVDYSGFNTINFICSPKRECEIEIPAGEPVLHVIPLNYNKPITASYGPSSQYEKDHSKIVKWFHDVNFYRKRYMIRKKFNMIFKKEE